MGMRVLLVLVILGIQLSYLNAQTAKVVQLKPSDAAKAKQVYKAMMDAENAWSDLQKEISNKYLIVDKNDPDAGNHRWYPPEDSDIPLGSVATGTTQHVITWNTNSVCETPEEKKAREAALQAEEQRRKDVEEKREARSKRYRRGWDVEGCYDCEPIEFEFSEGFNFIVPKAPKVEPPHNNYPSIIYGGTPVY